MGESIIKMNFSFLGNLISRETVTNLAAKA